MDNSAAQSDRDCFRPVAGTEFIHNVLDVNFHCLFRNKEPFGDIAISVTFGYVTEDFDFAVGKIVVSEMLGELNGDLCRNVLFSCVDTPDDFYDLDRRRGL